MFSRLNAVFLVLCFFSTVNAFGRLTSTWDFLLPHEQVQEMHQTELDARLTPLGVEKRINDVLVQNCSEQLWELELPAFYSQLPEVARWQARDILFSSNLTYDEKQNSLKELVEALPVVDRRLPPKPTCHGAERKSLYFDSYSAITYTVKFTFSLAELARKLYVNDHKSITTAFLNSSYTIEDKLYTLIDIMGRQPTDIQKSLFQTDLPVDHIFERLFFYDSLRDVVLNTTTKPFKPPSVSTDKPKVIEIKPPSPARPGLSKLNHKNNINVASIKKLMG